MAHTLKLNEKIKDIMQRADDRAGGLGLHIVHAFFYSGIGDELGHKSGYFEESLEAQGFAAYMYEAVHETDISFIIFCDGKIYKKRLQDKDLHLFMASEDDLRYRTYYTVTE